MIVKKSHLWKSKAMQKVTMETFVMWNGSWQRANEVLSGTQQQSWNILGWPNSLSGFFITSYEKTQTFGPPNANPIMSRQYAESWTHNSNELNIFVNLKTFLKVKSESHSVVSNSLWCHGLYSPWDSPGQNTGVGSLSLPQGIFPTQGLDLHLLCLLHWQVDSLPYALKESESCSVVSDSLWPQGL